MAFRAVNDITDYDPHDYVIDRVGLGLHLIHDDVWDLRAYLATKNYSDPDYRNYDE